MAFTIPDNDEAFNNNQSIWMQTDVNALVAGMARDGVVSGCVVSEDGGGASMDLDITSGTIQINDTSYLITGSAAAVTIGAADGSNPRIDLVSAENDDTLNVTAGSAAANPKAPDIPASSVLLAMVYVPANDTTIADNQITDKRVIVPIYSWFNVEDYGAVHDGLTDDTGAIQSTIDAAETAGGGVVYFPAGIYIVNGALQDTGRANAQLLLPSIDRDVDDAVTIELRGEYPPFAHPTVGTTIATPVSGSIIEGTLNAGAGGALIGCQAPVAATSDFSRLTTKIKDMAFNMPDNPVLSALNLGYVTGVELDNVFVYASTYVTVDTTEPTTATSYGIISPKNNNGAWSYFNAVNVVGFYNGLEVNEHTNGDNIHIWACKNGCVFEEANHASHFNRLMVVHCEAGLVFQGGDHYTSIDQLDIEHYDGSPPEWFDPIYDINDANDYGIGYANWHVVLGGSGPDSTFAKNSGRKLITPKIGGTGLGARVYHDANYSLSDVTPTAHPFNSEKYDTNNIHDNASNNTRLTCNTEGAYQIEGIVRFAADATGQRQLQILMNGSGSFILAQCSQDANSSGATHVQISTQYHLTAGDYLELVAYQSSGGALNSEVHVSGESAAVFSMQRI